MIRYFTNLYRNSEGSWSSLSIRHKKYFDLLDTHEETLQIIKLIKIQNMKTYDKSTMDGNDKITKIIFKILICHTKVNIFFVEHPLFDQLTRKNLWIFVVGCFWK